MSQTQVGKRTVNKACFVCFKAAEKGGEFLLVDGRRMLRYVFCIIIMNILYLYILSLAKNIYMCGSCCPLFRDLKTDVLQRWFDRQVRFSSAELPMGFMDKAGPLQPVIEPVVQKLLGTVVDMKVINSIAQNLSCRSSFSSIQHNYVFFMSPKKSLSRSLWLCKGFPFRLMHVTSVRSAQQTCLPLYTSSIATRAQTPYMYYN
jgi:hypothetical protein